MLHTGVRTFVDVVVHIYGSGTVFWMIYENRFLLRTLHILAHFSYLIRTKLIYNDLKLFDSQSRVSALRLTLSAAELFLSGR